MKSQWTKSLILAGCAAALSLAVVPAARAQNAKLDLGNLGKLADKADEVVDVTLDGPTLRFAQKFMTVDEDDDDAEALKLIKNLTGIYVKSYQFTKPDEYSEADLEAIRSQLRNSSWARLVGVESKHEHEKDEVYMMMDSSGKTSLGLAVIVAEPEELTVVNIVGPIDVDHLAELEGKMGIPHMGLKHKEHGGGNDSH